MKVLTADQMRQADAYTIRHEPVSSVDLMERAGHACFTRIAGMFGNRNPYLIICGTGNNGGDGLVIARLLNKIRIDCEVFIVPFDKRSADFSKMLEEAEKEDVKFQTDDDLVIKQDAIIIDAIFGTGLSKSPEGIAASVIKKMNASGNQIVSIDLPSGLFADRKSGDYIIEADHTLTFQNPKLTFFFAENEKYTGEWEIIDIKLDRNFINNNESRIFFTERSDISGRILPRKKFSHKGLYGHSLLICGSKGKAGAAILAARACLRTGTGLLTIHSPKINYDILQTSIPEAMVSVDDETDFISQLPDLTTYTAIGVGPGIGTENATHKMLSQLLNSISASIVLDADALNIISNDKELLKKLPPGSVLTPHPKEFARLAGESADGFGQFEKQREFTERYKVIVVLKGAYTCITKPGGEAWFNSTGNPGMAKGGTGDALTGMITALLAQKYEPADAALIAVYLHGLAGDIAAAKKSIYSLTAGDLIEKIPNAFRKILRQKINYRD